MTTDKTNEIHLQNNSNTTVDVHSVGQTQPNNSNRDLKRSWTIIQPKGTISYTVTDNDTLEKIALRFNATPSELVQLNKLITRIVFPGQMLYVPDESAVNNSDEQQSTTAPPSPPPPPVPATVSPTALTKPKDGDAFILLTDHRLSGELSPTSTQQDIGPLVWSMARQSTTARPGHAQRLSSQSTIEHEPTPKTLEQRLSAQLEDNTKQVRALRSSLTVEENHQLDEECLQRFIKVDVRLMTDDHHNIAGTLLITPNAVMFDPDVRDPLVKEHGIEEYGLIIRMDLLAGISLYEDLAMYEHEATLRDEEKRKMYRSISVKHLQHQKSNKSLNSDEQDIHDLMVSLLDKIDKELDSSTSTDTCKLFDASSMFQRHISKSSLDDDEKLRSLSTDESFFEDSLQLSNELFQPLDDYKHTIDILHNDDDNLDINRNYNRVPSQGCHLINCVSVDQFNKRFDEIDELLYKQQQHYFEPHPIEIPYYLCFKTSIHIHDIPSLYARQDAQWNRRRSSSIYERKRLENEYWFSVPKEKIDHLYTFFLRWTPERESNPLMDDDDEPQIHADPRKSNPHAPQKGFVLLATDDPELSDEHYLKKISKNQKNKTDQRKKLHYLKRQNTLMKDWETG